MSDLPRPSPSTAPLPGGAAAARALELVREGMVVGLGTGRAATAFVHALAGAVRAGLRVRGVATSRSTEALAGRLGIPLTSLDEVGELDLAVDGADEVDPHLDLVKGYGGALVRERIVAAASRRLVILVGPGKLVARLGDRGTVPVEVVPFGAGFCARRLAALGVRPRLRRAGAAPYVTDNGNHLLDCGVDPLPDPAATQRALSAIPGVVGTGLFLAMADTVLAEDDRGDVEERRRPG